MLIHVLTMNWYHIFKKKAANWNDHPVKADAPWQKYYIRKTACSLKTSLKVASEERILNFIDFWLTFKMHWCRTNGIESQRLWRWKVFFEKEPEWRLQSSGLCTFFLWSIEQMVLYCRNIVDCCVSFQRHQIHIVGLALHFVCFPLTFNKRLLAWCPQCT